MTKSGFQNMAADAYGDYPSDEAVERWGRIARKREGRDKVLLPYLARFLRKGTVLELGSAYGDVASKLIRLGFDVLASDFYPSFVNHMKRTGLPAEVIDATNIQAATSQQFDNVYAQGLTPHMRYYPPGMTEAVYESVHKALKPEGIFLVQTTNYPAFYDKFAPLVSRFRENRRKRGEYYTHEQQVQILKRLGLFDVLKVFRYQVLDGLFYRVPGTRHLAQAIDLAVPKILPSWAVRSIWVLKKRG